MKAQRGSRGRALFFLKLSTKSGWVVTATHWQLYHQERDVVPYVQEAGWDPRPVKMGAENLAPTGT
jgi:hypothetical protein